MATAKEKAEAMRAEIRAELQAEFDAKLEDAKLEMAADAIAEMDQAKAREIDPAAGAVLRVKCKAPNGLWRCGMFFPFKKETFLSESDIEKAFAKNSEKGLDIESFAQRILTDPRLSAEQIG